MIDSGPFTAGSLTEDEASGLGVGRVKTLLMYREVTEPVLAQSE